MAKITLAGREFKSRTAAQKYFSDVLKETPAGQYLPDDVAQMFIAWVYLRPDANEKIGPGVARVLVNEYTAYGRRNKQFLLMRVDGKCVDCSLRMSKQNENKNELTAKKAARVAIQDQLDALRAGYCDKYSLDCRGALHAHHAGEWTFARIYDEFVAQHGPMDVVDAGSSGIDYLAEPCHSKFRAWHAERLSVETLCQFHHTEEHRNEHR